MLHKSNKIVKIDIRYLLLWLVTYHMYTFLSHLHLTDEQWIVLGIESRHWLNCSVYECKCTHKVGSQYNWITDVNTLHATFDFQHPWNIVVVSQIFWNFTNFLTDTRYVCTYLNAFFMVMPKIVTKFQNFDIF